MAWAPACTWNYLRARGEYGDGHGACVYCRELPPRTRRIHAPAGVNNLVDGTTSAHAENTPKWLPVRALAGNYLRARGEYPTAARRHACMCELPPRTRRIREHTATGERQMGTTSAHAENTHHRPRRPRRPGNYLRARGEYDAKGFDGLDKAELPPRTRRIHWRFNACSCWHGTTSAHAENTSAHFCPAPSTGNYLRARGEYENAAQSRRL